MDSSRPPTISARAERSHLIPELLDWLAYRFIDDGWSTKQLIRTIVTSSTYRQSSNVRPDIQSKDPDNALLARLLPAATSGRTDP